MWCQTPARYIAGSYQNQDALGTNQPVLDALSQSSSASFVARACRFGYSLLMDMHSMPHEAVAHLGNSKQGIEVVLGDRYGASADIAFGDLIEQAFENNGFRVSRNVPFAGAYITQHYGQPEQSKHVVQVEIDRTLYLDEGSIRPSENFEVMKTRLRGVLR